MNAKLLLIDPQNDFMDIEGATLPVSGAAADMERLAGFMGELVSVVTDIVVTLDSHARVGIERTTFWTEHGKPVAPFTEITEHDVQTGRFEPRDKRLLPQALEYLRALEAGGLYRLIVWPVHCVIGAWGHNIFSPVGSAIAAWEEHNHRNAFKLLKGMNPMTEQYSAVRAEVPDENDPQTQTNRQLIARACPDKDGLLFVAGEAASHCVSSTMAHLFEVWTREERQRVVILRDCMSPVAGFEKQAERFFATSIELGASVMTSRDAYP